MEQKVMWKYCELYQQINEEYERLLKGDVKYRFVIDGFAEKITQRKLVAGFLVERNKSDGKNIYYRISRWAWTIVG